jgi:EmrB/QacA subfamily drug resistance transporter
VTKRDQGRWILAATILGSSMAFIDGSVVNIALPVMQKSLSATVTDAQWIVDSYLLVLASFLLAGGALGDHLGRMRVFAAGVAIFAAASVWCGMSPNALHLIAARTLQGIGGALLVPGSLAIIAAAFPASERGKAIGTWSALTSLATIAGPLLGGWLVQTISWRAIFFINIPIAAVTLMIVWHTRFSLASAAATDARPIDWAGTLLITMALAGLTYALIEAPAHRGIGAIQYAALAASAVALVAFIIIEKRVNDPIVPLTLFRSRSFTAANALTLLLYAALNVALFLLPFNLIQLQGYSPAAAGAAFLPLVITLSLLSRWTGALADRIGPRLPLLVGPLVAAAGFALLAIPGIGGSFWTTFFPGLVVLGIGMAITVAPLTTTVMTSIDDERHVGAASGINNAISRVAGLLAIALFGTVSIFVFSGNLDRRLQGESPAVRREMLAQSLKLAEAQPPSRVDDATRRRIREAIGASFLRAFRVNMFAAAALALASATAALWIESRPTHEKRT